MGLTMEQIGQAPLPVTKVTTPEWGGDGHCFVRTLAGCEMQALQALLKGKDEGRSSAAAVAFCLCDENGVRLCDDGTEAIDAVGRGPMAPMMRCMNAILELNGLSEGAVEDAVKN